MTNSKIIKHKDQKPPIGKEIIFHHGEGYKSIAIYEGGNSMQFSEMSGWIRLNLSKDFSESDKKHFAWEER